MERPVPRTRLKVGQDESQDTKRERNEVARTNRWLERNHAGLVAFERFVEKHGIFNEDDREW